MPSTAWTIGIKIEWVRPNPNESTRLKPINNLVRLRMRAMNEDPDIVDVLVSSQDFGHLDASEKFSMTSEDYHVLLADLENAEIDFDEVPTFMVQQIQNKSCTCATNKDLKRKANQDRGWLKDRVTKMIKGKKGGGRTYRKIMYINDIKARTLCRRCHKKGHWVRECTEAPAK